MTILLGRVRTGAELRTCSQMFASRTSHNISPQGARLRPRQPNDERSSAFAVLFSPIITYHDKAEFSLNFSSAGKGPFMATKPKNMCQRCKFLGGGGERRKVQ